MASEPAVQLTVLTLESDNPYNTKLLDDYGQILYTIMTDWSSRKRPFTRVFNHSFCRVAEWQWRDVLGDLIILGENSSPSKSSRIATIKGRSMFSRYVTTFAFTRFFANPYN
jgi:hypothetical protein